MWSSTSLFTSPHTGHLTSPAQFAIKGFPASPASNLISCCTRRRRLASQLIEHEKYHCTTFWESLLSLFCLLCHLYLQNLICSECGDEFVLQSQLSLHLEEHRRELSGIRVFACKTCDKEFKSAVHLKEHMKSHIKMRSANLFQFGMELKGILLEFRVLFQTAWNLNMMVQKLKTAILIGLWSDFQCNFMGETLKALITFFS